MTPTAEVLTLKTSPILSFGYLFQLLISLAIVISLIYLAAKYIFPRLEIKPKGKNIQVIEKTLLEPQTFAYLIKVYDKTFFVVTSNKNINCIEKFEEKSFEEHLKQANE